MTTRVNRVVTPEGCLQRPAGAGRRGAGWSLVTWVCDGRVLYCSLSDRHRGAIERGEERRIERGGRGRRRMRGRERK